MRRVCLFLGLLLLTGASSWGAVSVWGTTQGSRLAGDAGCPVSDAAIDASDAAVLDAGSTDR